MKLDRSVITKLLASANAHMNAQWSNKETIKLWILKPLLHHWTQLPKVFGFVDAVIE